MDNTHDEDKPYINVDGQMLVYTYDDEGRYSGNEWADPDPMEPGKFLMPPNSTSVGISGGPAQARRQGRWWFWNGEGWEYRDDPQAVVRQAERMRLLRNSALRESDWTQLPDAPLGPPERGTWRIYRHMLRTLPEQDGWPYIELPKMPEPGQNPTFL